MNREIKKLKTMLRNWTKQIKQQRIIISHIRKTIKFKEDENPNLLNKEK